MSRAARVVLFVIGLLALVIGLGSTLGSWEIGQFSWTGVAVALTGFGLLLRARQR